ncbi:membrane-associated phospholipid phosphatase [Vibrio ishigakensis]|uniref:undecaprenyl-diphosphate phosphatase n=1 Tax=Vibrio ishigakensis TaxID=1481914 RepID=A0A0B8QE29_9VIBR|nr:membrane-associated phospholipid phosphatase [Vibrio ishigakensis]GAM76886.1 membrane-associated phospholipid phosphatase [Vibrio ishigakensis]
MSSFDLQTQQITRINPIVRFDLAFSHLCVGHRYANQVGQFSRAVSHSGDGHLYPVIALMAWIADPVLGKLLLVCGLIAFAIELPIYWIAKNSFRRRRPHDLSTQICNFIEPSDKYSMPSGHTAAATIMATLICVFFPSLALIAVPWAAMIALSRILLGVHFFSDIVAGVILGVSATLTAMWIVGV